MNFDLEISRIYVLLITGTKIKFLSGKDGGWERVEDLAQKEELAMKASMKGNHVTQRWSYNHIFAFHGGRGLYLLLYLFSFSLSLVDSPI